MVQVKLGGSKIRKINGYGPQEDDPLAKRQAFWQAVEQEVIAAKNSQSMVLLQCDANAKLGQDIIIQDPHQISENGRLLKSLMDRENLTLHLIYVRVQSHEIELLGIILKSQSLTISL